MPDIPLVSIAAINYNNSKYVIETLESIRSQTYSNIELIIVDDCSTDNSVELIEDWLNTFNRPYKFIKHDINRGVGAACNSGVKNAVGKYYSEIATDDIMLPEKIKKQVDILDASNPNVAAVYSDAYKIDENSDFLDGNFIDFHRKFDVKPTGSIYAVLLEGNYIPGMSFLFKRDIFENVGLFDEHLIYEDYDMWLRIARKYEIIFSDFISVKYRLRSDSLTFVIKNWIYSDARIFLKHTDAALPISRIWNLAKRAYLTEDVPTLMLVNELAEKLNDDFLKTIYLLWKFKIPHVSGLKVVEKLSENNDSPWYRG